MKFHKKGCKIFLEFAKNYVSKYSCILNNHLVYNKCLSHGFLKKYINVSWNHISWTYLLNKVIKSCNKCPVLDVFHFQ